jgi:heterodisulfide reductase subunit B
MFDTQQLNIERRLKTKYDLPALFYPQLLGLTLGYTFDDLGFQFNRVPADKIKTLLSKIEQGE